MDDMLSFLTYMGSFESYEKKTLSGLGIPVKKIRQNWHLYIETTQKMFVTGLKLLKRNRVFDVDCKFNMK